jgi:hypothetical protein
MLTGIVGFLVHSGAIYAGAKLSKQDQVHFVNCLVVALVSYATMFLVGLLLAPLTLLPLLGVLVKAAVIWLGTALAAKFVLNLEWKPALSLGAAVAVIQGVLMLVFRY